jgi:GDP-4-dehydro-6-deoxy-D-mannose reductase
MKVLVTGADGFVGRHLVRRLVGAGDEVAAGCRPVGQPVDWSVIAPSATAVQSLPLEITDADSVHHALRWGPDAIVHLAAIASTRDAGRDPVAAWVVNAAGTALLVNATAAARDAGAGDPMVLIVSTGEVYGGGHGEPRVETDPLLPQSSYAASKVGAEAAALEVWRRTGLRVVIARPFTHTGPGQTTQYVVPGWAERLHAAKLSGAPTVATGNLDPVRDFLDVRDVVDAYRLLLSRGGPGEAYNVSRGEGLPLAELFALLSGIIGARATARPDPSLVRGTDIPYLVGDSTKLRRTTGWAPAIGLERTLRELVDAQAH